MNENIIGATEVEDPNKRKNELLTNNKPMPTLREKSDFRTRLVLDGQTRMA